MILIALQEESFFTELAQNLEDYGALVTSLKHSSLKPYLETLRSSYVVVVTSAQHPSIDQELWREVLRGWCHKTSLFLREEAPGDLHNLPPDIHYTPVRSSAADLADIIQKEFGIGPSWFSSGGLTPLLDEHKLSRALVHHKILYHVYVDASAHSNIYTEYGVKVHLAMLELLESSLRSVWQDMGYRTPEDLIFRKDADSSVYMIFTPLSQFAHQTPPLGFLADMAYRFYCLLQKRVQQCLHEEVSQDQLYRITEKMLSFSVGYASLMYNPCFSIKEQIEKGIQRAQVHADYVKHRSFSTEREFLQFLMIKKDSLFARFQGVFDVQNLTEEDIPDPQDPTTFERLQDRLYGFEALLGINKDALHAYLKDHTFSVTADSLNPYSLFQIAQRCDLSLELDQVCINLATAVSSRLPGTLLVNIFPRNFYYIEKLSHLLPAQSKIVFELAESRIIKNFDFLLEARKRLKHVDCGLAADDVCQGYASFQRLLTVQPDLVKLAREIVAGADKDPKKELIIKTFVEYSHRFSHKVIAEGVETLEEFLLCKKLKVDYVQGFLWHRPVAFPELQQQFKLKADPQQSSSEKEYQEGISHFFAEVQKKSS